MDTHKLLILLGVCIALLGCALYAVQMVITVAFSIAAMACVAIGILMMPKKEKTAPPFPPAKPIQLPITPMPLPTGKISEGVGVVIKELPTGIKVVPAEAPMTPNVSKVPPEPEAPAPVVTEKPAPTLPGGVDLDFPTAETMKAKHSFISWLHLDKPFTSVTGAKPEPAGVELTAGILVGFDEEKKEFIVWIAGAEQKKIKEVREVTRCAHKEDVVKHVKELMQKVNAGAPI